MNVTPVINWAAAAPLIIVLGAGVVGTLFEAFLPRKARRPVQVAFSFLALAAALVAVVWRWGAAQTDDGTVMLMPLAWIPDEGLSISLVEDAISLIGQGILLIVALLAVLVMADRTEIRDGAFVASAATRPGSPQERESIEAGREHTEIYPLVLFSTGGMMAFTSAFDLLTLFIALEVISLPLYVLSAMARRRRLISQEAAMKYFLMGAFSSAVFLMGAALVYGATGGMAYASLLGSVTVSLEMGVAPPPFAVVGTVMVLIGLLFKMGAAPFHSWTPDVYQGAPTPVTGFMAAGVKAAAFVAFARFYIYFAQAYAESLNVFMWIIIILTILVGTAMGIVQKDVKRMLAYSAIAHAGFILIAVNALSMVSLSAILFYLLTYGIATVGAFGIISLVRAKDAAGNVLGEANSIDAWRGLGKRAPLTAGAMLIFLLSFAGIPLTGGFIGKFEVFRAGVAGGETPLVVIGVLASAATAFFYFRLVQIMFFSEPENNNVAVLESEGMASMAIVMAAVVTLLLGIMPDPVLTFIQGCLA